MTLALIVAAMATSCQKDDLSGSSGSGLEADAAYVSLSIETPSTRAASSEADNGVSQYSSLFTGSFGGPL